VGSEMCIRDRFCAPVSVSEARTSFESAKPAQFAQGTDSSSLRMRTGPDLRPRGFIRVNRRVRLRVRLPFPAPPSPLKIRDQLRSGSRRGHVFDLLALQLPTQWLASCVTAQLGDHATSKAEQLGADRACDVWCQDHVGHTQ